MFNNNDGSIYKECDMFDIFLTVDIDPFKL